MPFITDSLEFREEQERRVISFYNSNRQRFQGFESRQRFVEWYLHELYIHDNRCHYCEVSILDIRRLINEGIILGRSVSGGGLRGPNFEVDRRNPLGEYEEANCVLSCYYCNNDKSNTFDYETYKYIFGPHRRNTWNILLERLR